MYESQIGFTHEQIGAPWREPRGTIKLARHEIVTYGCTEEETGLIAAALSLVPEKMRRSIPSISVLGKRSKKAYEHFGNLDDNPKEPIPAHCHHNGCICLRRGNQIDSLIWHEAAHALTFALGYEIGIDDFETGWKQLADVGYGVRPYREDSLFPRDGVLAQYGIRNAKEDIAVWVAEIYQCFIRQIKGPFELIDKNDLRYLGKLEMLRARGFIKNEVFNYTRPLLT